VTRTRPATSDLTPRSRQLLRHTGVVAALPVLGILLGPAAAQAETGDKRAAAETLFNDALALVEAGSWAAGCPKFEQSFALFPSRSTTIRIARCQAHEGKIATAWEEYQRALRVDDPEPDAERQRDLMAIAAAEAKALEPRLPRLRVVIASLPAGARVQRDGLSLPKDALGQSFPIDPGRHEVTAAAPGYRGETRSVLLREGETVTVEMTLVHASPPATGWLMPAGIGLAVAGAVGLGAGAATGVASLSLTGGVRASCGGVHCLTTDMVNRQNVSNARTLGDVSTVSLIAGGAFAVAGGALLLLKLSSSARSDAGAAPAASLQATLGPGQVTLQGRF
jgi:hypothetical protein